MYLPTSPREEGGGASCHTIAYAASGGGAFPSLGGRYSSSGFLGAPVAHLQGGEEGRRHFALIQVSALPCLLTMMGDGWWSGSGGIAFALLFLPRAQKLEAITIIMKNKS